MCVKLVYSEYDDELDTLTWPALAFVRIKITTSVHRIHVSLVEDIHAVMATCWLIGRIQNAV